MYDEKTRSSRIFLPCTKLLSFKILQFETALCVTLFYNKRTGEGGSKGGNKWHLFSILHAGSLFIILCSLELEFNVYKPMPSSSSSFSTPCPTCLVENLFNLYWMRIIASKQASKQARNNPRGNVSLRALF